MGSGVSFVYLLTTLYVLTKLLKWKQWPCCKYILKSRNIVSFAPRVQKFFATSYRNRYWEYLYNSRKKSNLGWWFCVYIYWACKVGWGNLECTYVHRAWSVSNATSHVAVKLQWLVLYGLATLHTKDVRNDSKHFGNKSVHLEPPNF